MIAVMIKMISEFGEYNPNVKKLTDFVHCLLFRLAKLQQQTCSLALEFPLVYMQVMNESKPVCAGQLMP